MIGGPAALPREAASVDRLGLAVLLAGALALAGPTLWDLAAGAWKEHTQGHEVAIFAICAWLLWRRREALASLPAPASRMPGLLLLALALLVYVVGRSQQILRLEMLALPGIALALLVYWRGAAALRPAAFPLAFSLFAVPLPFEWVLTLTAPLKHAVSAVAVAALDAVGYPVARTGVVITIGQYELLVTEACAGLQTMFTLEAMGLLYASLVPHARVARNVALAVIAVPAAFASNVVRVVVLALITFHFGDAAGQGFLHGASGLVLFVVALLLIVAADVGLRRLWPQAL